ncbi:odorant receptor 13a isoform X2 [Solenopsis invicta]|uniref:odorant receptor 13a isoform X2 n=1 Tax=Solenopsis invicta TaxID=13686 RepID=UPI000E33D766|nr:odorant receptor 13a isoform X2 [Solenopsis invicta]
MSFFDNRYYYVNKRLLSVIGQWPFQSRLESNMMFAVTSLFIFSLTAFEFWGLAAGITDLNIIMENASPLLVNCMMIIKFINCVITNDKMKVLYEDIEQTWKKKCTGAEKEILQRYAEKSRSFTIRYAIALYATWLFYSTTPLVITWIYKLLPTNETYTARFLYRMEHVLDMDKYFNLLMLHGFISVFYIVQVPIALESTFVFCTHHICALLECIRYNIECLQSTDFVLLEPNIKDDKTYHDLVDCIKSYKHVLKLSDVLASNYAVSFLFLLGNIIICLSFGAAEIIIIDIQLDELIRILAADLAQVAHIYVLSMISQRLIDHSSAFQDVIYSCDWYNMSIRSRRLVMFTIMRTTKPCEIKAGKIFVMSMENFSSILKVSLSYFTMLTSLQESEKTISF